MGTETDGHRETRRETRAEVGEREVEEGEVEREREREGEEGRGRAGEGRHKRELESGRGAETRQAVACGALSPTTNPPPPHSLPYAL